MVLLISQKSSSENFFRKLHQSNSYASLTSTDILLQIEKAVAQSSKAVTDEHKAALAGVEVSADAQKIADMYTAAKTAMIVYNQGELSYDGALSLVNTAVMAGF